VGIGGNDSGFDYAIDLYEDTAIDDTRRVGMGGAGIALLVGAAGTLRDPSAPAVGEHRSRHLELGLPPRLPERPVLDGRRQQRRHLS